MSRMIAEHWWFWILAGGAATVIVLAEPRWRGAAVALRAAALRRRLVEEGAGMTVDSSAGGRWSEPWLPALLVGLWVCASPWIWGYEDVDGAIETDVVTGAVIATVSLAGVPFPALLSLNLLAGLWLTTAPWLVGFGTEGGAVGLSDAIAGVVTCGLALRGMTAATRRLRAAQPGPVGRIPRRGPG
jgi:hypothetical protein